jgi:hypothetical protein
MGAPFLPRHVAKRRLESRADRISKPRRKPLRRVRPALFEQQRHGRAARTVHNLYDLNGSRIRSVQPDNSFFAYEHDWLDRPTWIYENGGYVVTFTTYDSFGRPASRSKGLTGHRL